MPPSELYELRPDALERSRVSQSRPGSSQGGIEGPPRLSGGRSGAKVSVGGSELRPGTAAGAEVHCPKRSPNVIPPSGAAGAPVSNGVAGGLLLTIRPAR